MKKPLIIFFSALLLILRTLGNTYAFDATEPGDLELHIVGSDRADYIEEWMTTPPKHAVVIKFLRRVIPDQTAYFAFLATGQTTNMFRWAKLVVHWTLYGPDGEEVFSNRNHAKYSGFSLVPGFIMLDKTLEIILYPSDPAGQYHLVGVLEDLVAKTKTTDEYVYELVEQGGL
jgi:hypothetical protein